MNIMEWVILIVTAAILLQSLNILSYRILKKRILRRQKWDLNICSGRTDGGGVNADIAVHAKTPRFVIIDSIYSLPFKDRQFSSVLCSHTMEHVEKPDAFWRELKRVGRRVTIVLPPLWDLAGVMNFWEHRWIFLTFRKVHDHLPPRIPLPLSRVFQRRLGQRIHA
ncbi:MAG: hypothetical protein A2Y86_02385 [Candidatus Aminicenantes bacterium RBG_13_62_12]|nr:MAG: hypothetical protein A2Y86_02385 [Candidatus Aminicenantes bacterium RBG_13_62_12]